VRKRYDFLVRFHGRSSNLTKKLPHLQKGKKSKLDFSTISWQRSGNVKLGSAAAVPSLTARRRRLDWQRGCTARCHWGMAASAATNAVLPPRAAAMAMKTLAATAMAGVQKSTIN
jgi:hypothetical protein